jgi:hypothetical protein
MEQILTGNHRLLRDLNSNVILNRIRTEAPAIRTNLAFINDAKPSMRKNIFKSPEDMKAILKNETAGCHSAGIQSPGNWKNCGNYCLPAGIMLENNKIIAHYIEINTQLLADKKRNKLPSSFKLLFRQRITILPTQKHYYEDGQLR